MTLVAPGFGLCQPMDLAGISGLLCAERGASIKLSKVRKRL